MLDSLPLEEFGAISALEDLIHLTGNYVVNDDRYLARQLRVDVRVVRRLRPKLEEAGFYIFKQPNGPDLLRHPECDESVDAALARITSAAQAGAKSGIRRRYKSQLDNNERKDLPRTAVPTTVGTTVGTDVRTNNKSLHILPSEECGETVLNAEQTQEFIERLRAAIGSKRFKDYPFSRAKIVAPSTIVFECKEKLDAAMKHHGQELQRLGCQMKVRRAA